jgi:osmotically-inducible protein OsmY
MTPTDKALQEAILKELEWDPKVDAAHVGVAVKEGAVILSGYVSSYSERWAAVQAAERVYGVRALADEIKVKLSSSSVRDDDELAEEIARTLKWNTLVPSTVKAEVRKGFVTLVGEVDWSYQRQEAERGIRNIEGITGVTNLIKVKPAAKAKEVEELIKDAIKRAADLDARQIWVTSSNGTIELHGHVHSVWEKKVAEEAALKAPGVQKVENKLVVIP